MAKAVNRLEIRRRSQIEAMKMSCEPIRLSVAATQYRIRQQDRIITDRERQLDADILSVKSLLARIKQLRSSIREEEGAILLHRWNAYLGNGPVKKPTLRRVSSGLLMLIATFSDSKQPDGRMKNYDGLYISESYDIKTY
ncbi:hypothetical protein FA95DRAFT_1577459 [Auriscalpium vulgare]|uniref:Uncharacterized protein n=1 Tax=Auriscalpium vulgare TaxID=40419 RepID=A0ACB8R699_9AGAM|nr:hypothetical protein FA95DRAFT_1577459 [Auriscalpium vulgare]